MSHSRHVHAPDADRSLFDRLGIGVSVTCAVHCVLSALVALAPTLGISSLGISGPGAFGVGTAMEWLEVPFLLAALGIGLWALLPAYRREHGKPLAIRLFLVGISLIIASRLVVSPLETSTMETGLTVVGVFFVASAHVANLRAHAAHHRASQASAR